MVSRRLAPRVRAALPPAGSIRAHGPAPRRRAVPSCALAALLFAAAVAVTAPAQEGLLGRARRVLLVFDFEPGAAYTQIEQRLLYESLLQALTGASERLLVLEWDGEALADERARSDAALERACDGWVAVRMDGSFQAAAYRLEAYDLATRKRVAQGEYAREPPLRLRDLESRFWDEAVAGLADGFASVEYGTRVVLRGTPGTAVAGLAAAPLALEQDGELALVLPNPSVYSFRATHPRHNPVNRTFILGDEPLEIELEQQPAPRFFAEGYLVSLSAPGIGAAWYLLPNRLYLRADLSSYLLGLYFAFGRDEEDPPLLQSRPLSTLHLGAGSYLNRPEARVRLYGGAAAVLRIVHARGLFGLEPIAPLAAELTLGTEVAAWRRLNLYIEAAPTWYFSRDPELLASSYPSYHSAFHAVKVPGGLIDFLGFRLGLRRQL